MSEQVQVLRLYLDRDFDRLGFDRSSLLSDGVELAESERLSAETALIVVASYVGGLILDKATGGTLDRVVEQLLSFARSKDKRLRLELEAKGVDPRVMAFLGSVEVSSRTEFAAAIKAVPLLRIQVDRILAANEEHWRELAFVWSDGAWRFSFGLTSDGEIVEDEKFFSGDPDRPD